MRFSEATAAEVAAAFAEAYPAAGSGADIRPPTSMARRTDQQIPHHESHDGDLADLTPGSRAARQAMLSVGGA